jgi:O-antigen/teichoic acid export membrane protein
MSGESTGKYEAKIARGGVLWMSGSLFGQAFRYVAAAAIARYAGAGTLGDFGLVMGVERFSQGLANAGLPQTNLKYVAHCAAQGDGAGARAVARQTALLATVTSLFACSVLWVLSSLLAERVYGRPELTWPFRLAALALPLDTIRGTLLAIPQAARDVRPRVLIDQFGLQALVLVGTIVSLLLGGELVGLVLTYVLGGAVALLVTLALLPRWLGRYEKEGHPLVGGREVLRYSVAMLLAASGQMIMTYADVMIVGRYVPADALGAYVAASRTAAFVTFPQVAVGSVFSPTIAHLFAKKEMGALRCVYATSTSWATGAACAILGPMTIAPALALVLMGSEFVSATPMLIAIGIGQLLNVGTGSVGSLLPMTGGQRVHAITNWVGAVALVGLLLLVVPVWGAMGAAIVVAGTTAGINLARLGWVYWRAGLQPYDLRFAVSAGVTSALVGALAWAVYRLGGDWRYGLGALGVFALVYTPIFRYLWYPARR